MHCWGLHWLRTGRCTIAVCTQRGDAHWQDHVTRWTRDGLPALMLAQPYGIGGKDLAQLAELDRDPAISVSVFTNWYGSGTVSVEVWREDASAGKQIVLEPWPMPGTFLAWLDGHRDDDTPIGDIARDATADEDWPQQPGAESLDLFQVYLDNAGASQAFVEAMTTAWVTYSDERR